MSKYVTSTTPNSKCLKSQAAIKGKYNRTGKRSKATNIGHIYAFSSIFWKHHGDGFAKQ